MYKIHKDDQNPGKYRLQYFMPANLLDPLYTVMNLTWEDTERFMKNTQIEVEDIRWIYDLIRLLDKQVSLTDTGKWSVL